MSKAIDDAAVQLGYEIGAGRRRDEQREAVKLLDRYCVFVAANRVREVESLCYAVCVATSFDSLLARREIYWMMRFAVRWLTRGNCAQQAPATDRVLQVVVLLFGTTRLL